MTDENCKKEPEELKSEELDQVQGGNTISVQICHQVVGQAPAKTQERDLKEKPKSDYSVWLGGS